MQLFRSMVTEQLTDGYAKAVSFSTQTDGQHGTSLSVQTRTSLQRPRSKSSFRISALLTLLSTASGRSWISSKGFGPTSIFLTKHISRPLPPRCLVRPDAEAADPPRARYHPPDCHGIGREVLACRREPSGSSINPSISICPTQADSIRRLGRHLGYHEIHLKYRLPFITSVSSDP